MGLDGWTGESARRIASHVVMYGSESPDRSSRHAAAKMQPLDANQVLPLSPYATSDTAALGHSRHGSVSAWLRVGMAMLTGAAAD